MTEDRIRDRIRVLRAERDAIDRVISELGLLLVPGTLAASVGPPEPAPKAETPPGKPPAPAARGDGGSRKDWPRLLLELMAGGPKRVMDLQAETGAAQSTLKRHLEGNPWFERVDPANRLSPWRLTPAGRSSLGSAAGAG